MTCVVTLHLLQRPEKGSHVPSKRKQQSKSSPPQWKRMDLHLHTPASADFREPNVTYLDILKRAEHKGLDIIAITDHNTAAGYRRYMEEIQDLELLERRNRLTPEEKEQLTEFRRLREKILVLPGFELTATLGFHVLGVFPPETTVRELEHLLLDLNVPPDKLDVGSGEVGATTDVLTAYRLINEAGGLVIAAHANSSHGVAMPGFDFGGQTRIAYTQDENLHALEVTDLASKSRRRTQLFFSGTKPEYPRKMHAIQGSDAHRVNGIPGNNQELGIGDRPTEILVSEASFDAIMDVLTGKDFSKTRPYVPAASQEFDPIFSAREEGDTLVQAFHESVGKHGIDRRILQDVVALANTNGGTIYIGASANVRHSVQGVTKPFETSTHLRAEINKHVVPPIDVQVDTLKSGGKQILQMIVPRGSEAPYTLDSTQIFVRSENETSLAVRDEIVNLVRDALAVEFAARSESTPSRAAKTADKTQKEDQQEPEDKESASDKHTVPPDSDVPEAAPKMPGPPPHTGVEIVASKTRPHGNNQYTMRDLRNNRIIHNVTRSSARKLWQYAIAEHDKHAVTKADVRWLGDVGIVKASERAGKLRYDLVQRDSNGELHVYYGVTDDGIHGVWKDLIETLSESTPVEQLEDDDNGEIHLPEGFNPPTESVTGELESIQAPTLFAADDSALPIHTESESNDAAEAAEDRESPRLLTRPGRSQFPPGVADLTPFVSESHDPAALSATVELETPPADADELQMHFEQGGAHSEVSIMESDEFPHVAVDDATAAIEPTVLTAESIILPDAMDVVNAPTDFAQIVPTEIEPGETLMPVLDPPSVETPQQAPGVSVNLDDQFVLPPNWTP